MKELFDFLDDNLSEQPESASEHAQHWLDARDPMRGCADEEEGFGIELLEKPGINGCGVATTERPLEE